MTASEWFPGEGRDADDEAFLAELRACADARGLVDAAPEDTMTARSGLLRSRGAR